MLSSWPRSASRSLRSLGRWMCTWNAHEYLSPNLDAWCPKVPCRSRTHSAQRSAQCACKCIPWWFDRWTLGPGVPNANYLRVSGILAAWLLARGEAGLGSLVPVPAPSMGLRLGMDRERSTTSTSALSVTCLSPPPRAACPSFGYKHQPALSTNPLFHWRFKPRCSVCE